MTKDEALNPSLLKNMEKSKELKKKPEDKHVKGSLRKSRIKRINDEGDKSDKAPLWLITFTDAIALMLTFFVLLYAMSTPKKEKFEQMTSAMNKEFGEYFTKKWNAGNQDTISIDKVDSTQALNLKYLQALLTDVARESKYLSQIMINLQKNRLIISLPTGLIFSDGSAEVQEKGKRAIFVIGDVLSRIRNKIEVIGHADPRPVSGAFHSNWDLSLSRAASVAGVLQDIGYSRHITIRGLSDGRYSELPEEMTEKERLQLSRRVDIVILYGDGKRRQILKLD